MKQFLFSVFLISGVLSACHPEAEDLIAPTLEETTFSHSTTDEEVDQLLMAKYGTSAFSTKEKLEFLSDHFAAEYQNKYAGRTESNLYVAIAQVFDGTSYFTDVATGDGSSNVRASVYELRHDQLAFAGANANVYLNGTNIGGRISNAQNLTCIGEEISLVSRAYWNTHSGGNTQLSAYIKCDK